MIEFELYILADTIAAAVLAAVFVAGYAYDRKLTAFLWWAGFYGLMALSLGTTVTEPDHGQVWQKTITWFALFASTAVASCALRREGSMTFTPKPTIFASAGLFVVLAGYLIATDASNTHWALIAPIPAMIVVAASTWRVLGQNQLKVVDWLTGSTLLVGLALIFGRSLWFAHLDAVFSGATAAPAAPLWPAPPPLGMRGPLPPPVPLIPPEQPLIVSLMTTLVLMSLAISSVMRAAMNAIDGMRVRSATDALSGLLNRASFDERAYALAEASGKSSGICVVAFDIDHFKQVNDTAGHAAGDRVISALGAVIKEAVSENQIAGRIGGEEFAVVLPGSTLGAARLFAEAVRTRFSACDFGPDITWTVTVSGGVAARHDDEPFHALMARADQALYAAKRSGRDRVALASNPPVRVDARVQPA